MAQSAMDKSQPDDDTDNDDPEPDDALEAEDTTEDAARGAAALPPAAQFTFDLEMFIET